MSIAPSITTPSSPWGDKTLNIRSVRVAANQTVAPIECTEWFYFCSRLTSCDLTGLDFSNNTSTYKMFSECSELQNLDLSNFNTSNVINMSSMFENCSELTSLDLSNFDTSKVVDMMAMFSGCINLQTLDLSNFNIDRLSFKKNIFNNCRNLRAICSDLNWQKKYTNIYLKSQSSNPDFSQELQDPIIYPIDTNYDPETYDLNNELTIYASSQAASFSFIVKPMQDASTPLNVDPMYISLDEMDQQGYIDSRQLKSVEIQGNQYCEIEGSIIGLYCDDYFSNSTEYTEEEKELCTCFALTWISSLYPVNYYGLFKSSSVESMFSNCISLIGGAGTEWSSNYIDETYAHPDGGTENPGYFTSIEQKSREGNAYAMFNEETNELILFRSYEIYENNSIQVSITDIWGNTYESEVTVFTISEENEPSGWNRSGGLNKWLVQTIKILPNQIICPKNTESWFSNFQQLVSCNLTGLDTSNVIDMSGMFDSCYSLTSLDLSNFDTSNVEYMTGMFSFCSLLTSLDLSNFNTSNVTDMSTMFTGCSSLTSLDLSNFNTSNVTDMSGMFSSCYSLISLDLSSFNTSNVITMSHMFDDCGGLEKLILLNFTTENAFTIINMFSGCRNLRTIYCDSDWKQENKDIYDTDMFDGCVVLIGEAGSVPDDASDINFCHVDTENNPGAFTSSIQEIESETVYALPTNSGGYIIQTNYPIVDLIGINATSAEDLSIEIISLNTIQVFDITLPSWVSVNYTTYKWLT